MMALMTLYYVLFYAFTYTHNTCNCNHMKLRHSTICTLYSPTHKCDEEPNV